MFKQVTFSLLAVLFAALAMSVAVAPAKADATVATTLEEAGLAPSVFADALANPEAFLTLTPKKYREMTGKKMSLKEVIVLKVAQKKVKKEMRRGSKEGEQFPKGLFIVCAIFVPIAAVIFMGVMDDWKGNTWWTALILYALCYIPGLIYTLTKIKQYYPAK